MPHARGSGRWGTVAGLTALTLTLVACSSSPSSPASSTSSSAAVSGSQVTVPASTAPASSPVLGSSIVASTLPTSSPLPKTTETTATKTAAPNEPTDPLTGLKVSSNPVIAVKIDNTYFGVAQFGVSDADMVFVEQVEGGLTRLISVFHSDLKVEVGPVRSVRSTDAELLPVFGRPALVFSGGAGGPLADLAKTDIVDTSSYSGYFRSSVAYGTYNLHANLEQIEQQAARNGIGKARPIGLTFAANDSRIGRGKTVKSVTVTWPAATTEFAWLNGHYVRQRDGESVRDYQGQLEQADNLLVLHVTDRPDGTVDTNGQPSYLTNTVGTGALSLFRDGHQLNGTWTRASTTSAFVFKDASGKPLPFKQGKTWVILAPQTASVATG